MPGQHDERRKRAVAAISLFAAVGLTAFKLVVGLATGSLGILAEAAHSGLDLVAALITWLAVRASSKPADREHPYGHGRFENISALFETLLLLVTCLWIIRASVLRLISHRVDIEVTVWSFAVMAVSVVVDISRSRALSRAAKEFRSQALEADALHFRTDIWSSCVVIAGLIGVRFQLMQADAVAALLVAVLVIIVSWRLGLRAVYALADTAPAGLQQQIIAVVEAVPGVANCHNVRIRNSGPLVFADIHVLIAGGATLAETHDIMEAAEDAIRRIIPDADVTIHPEPRETHPPVSQA
ncbi:MAG TPA: cation diffusion facilitator family transporter [Bryobacteraceae bacterium]|nr:cation diffusion facilitator family transporter [Bryobacteraceae bacterium]